MPKSTPDCKRDEETGDIPNLIEAVESAEDVIMADRSLLQSLITFFLRT